jgi:hypothetical protein
MLSNKKCLLGLLVAGTLVGTSVANATVTNGSSNGYGLSATALGIQVPLTPLPNSFGTAPAPYDTGVVVVNIAPTVIGPLVLGTATLSSRAASDVNGVFGPNTTYGFGEIDQTVLGLGSIPLVGVLGLTAGVLGSTSVVTGDYGSLMRAGQSQIVNLSLTLGLSTFNLGVGPVAANTNLFSLLPALSPIGAALSTLGINIILNEQSGVCNFISFCEQETNALHISVHPLGLNAADVVLGHSYAKELAIPTAAVPEASTYGMMLAGLGLVGAMVARRRNDA